MKILQSATPGEKKKREKESLLAIYSPATFQLKENLRPDFEAINTSTQEPFGIEVTELYFSEASARIKNHPSYVEAILNRGHYVTAKDKKNLQVVELRFFTPEGEPKGNLKAITVPDPGKSAFQQKFKERLQDKMRKYPTFHYPLDLVVHDQEKYLSKKERKYAAQIFFTDPELCQLLVQSPFREVFYLGVFHAEVVYIPLRTALFLTHVGLFHYYYAEEGQKLLSGDEERLLLLSFVLKTLGYRDVHVIRSKDSKLFCLLNRTVVDISSATDIKMLMFQKGPLPEGEQVTFPGDGVRRYQHMFPAFLSFISQRIIQSDHFVLPAVREGEQGLVF